METGKLTAMPNTHAAISPFAGMYVLKSARLWISKAANFPAQAMPKYRASKIALVTAVVADLQVPASISAAGIEKPTIPISDSS